ncbi:TPA: hypothetical protein HA235_06005 [Candidatus Woesearchaeota archaeon]|nr:hypothetical protein [Candidatus Woesearchaeota archaeon]
MRANGTVLENCPFCGRQALIKNPQGVAVCNAHKDTYLKLKCICGQPLDVMNGKYGSYGNCLKCGNMSIKKALGINDTLKPMPAKTTITDNDHKPINTIIRSDDPDYF